MPRAEVLHILLQFADGTIGAMQFVVGTYNTRTGEPIEVHEPTPEAIQAEIDKMQVPSKDEHGIEHTALPKEKIPVQSWRFCAPDEYPQDRTYLDAWRDRNGKIEHDIVHAREIHRGHLRRDRGPRLEALDVDYQRADEHNDQQKKRDIAAKKQRLRDAPADPRIDAAQTVDELKAITLPE